MKAVKRLFALSMIVMATQSLHAQNTLPTSGNVGIGTTSPSSEFEVMGKSTLGKVSVRDTAIFDKPVLIKDSVTLERKLTVDQDMKIKGEAVFVGEVKAKSDLKILGVTKMKGDAFVEGDFKFKGLQDLNLNDERFLMIKPNGKAVAIEKGFIAEEAYGKDCKFSGLNQPITTYWKSIPNLNHGILSTGANCPSWVGIGTETPEYNLDVIGISQSQGIRLKDNTGVTYLKNVSSGSKNCLVLEGDFTSLNFSDANASGTHNNGIWGIEYNPGAEGLNFWRPDLGGGNWALFLGNDGNVGIGTQNAPYKLSVDGAIGARLVRVELDTWSDHVFEEDYKMLSIEELDKYVKVNKHLPNVPSEKEVLENGIDLGQTDAILLEKIEELALYIIQLKKENEKMKNDIENLKR
jgi:hypothetical protein